MKNKILKFIKAKQGTTFIELLLYVAIFLILTPILLSVAINSLRTDRQFNLEQQVNADSQFVAERIYDLISESKRIDINDSILDDSNGRLSMVLHDDSRVIIELNNNTVEITEGGVTASLSSSESIVEQLYFEKIDDNLNYPELALGINIRMKVTGLDDSSVDQDYVLSANLERGDYDDDGCLDYVDAFPYHAACCKDGDSDGMCDELDNCVLQYNPFQEDYDGDDIGDACDLSAFFEGGTGSGVETLGAFNCVPDQDLLDLLYQDPPASSSILKSILLSSSPLSSVILWALENTHPLLTEGHFNQVILNNMGLPDDIYQAIIALNLTPGHIQQIINAQAGSTEIPAVIYFNGETIYQLSFSSDSQAVPPAWTNIVKFHTPDYALCTNEMLNRTDVFVLDVQNGSDTVNVTTETVLGTETITLTTTTNYVVNNQGIALEFNEKVGNAYAILASSDSCVDAMDSIEINFGAYASILNPPTTDTSYTTTRFTSYCPGGCDTGCGDVGTGIVADISLTDTCYLSDQSLPEWCSRWHTFIDNDTSNPAYVGGTNVGQETAYWEKTFKSILTILQLQFLKSFTLTGEIAYQSITQFFCDTLASTCPINGNLVGPQNLQLYNYVTETWVTIGTLNLDGTTSDQQTFEIIYSGTDMLEFFDQGTLTEMKARIEFSWDGIAPQGGSSAPTFMLLDYFTIHLLW